MGNPIDELAGEAADVVEPTETPPVPAADRVTCVHCKQVVPLAETDVVGLGYRCRACTDRAEIDEENGEPDINDHLNAADRAQFAAWGRRLALRGLGLSLLLAALGVAMLYVFPSMAAIKLLILSMLVLLMIGGLGLERWRRFRVRKRD